MTRIVILMILLQCICGGGIIEHTHITSEMPINFIESFYVPKFDSTVGQLDKVEFVLTGRYTGSSRAENLSPVPVTITLNNNVKFKQGISGGDMLFDEVISRTDVFNALGWDGSFPPDWEGQSGEEFLFSTYVQQTYVLEKTDMASIVLFTGIGDIHMNVFVNDVSNTSMSGQNIVASQFENQKSAISLVRYHYTPVPEPYEYGLVGGGVCVGLILYVRYRSRYIV